MLASALTRSACAHLRQKVEMMKKSRHAKAPATMALFSGFAVTVCDPREEYRGAWLAPGVTVPSEMSDDVLIAFKPERRSCVTALTHDPKLDDLALLEALATNAIYVGAIGIHVGRQNAARDCRPPEGELLALKNELLLPRDMKVARAKSERAVPGNDAGELVCGVARAPS